jgi:TrmH family RNA methyltransferase
VKQSDKLSKAEEFLSENITVVLVRTSHPGNVGAVARAMKNMGLSKLTLVSPSEAYEKNEQGETIYLSPLKAHDAIRRASGAEDILSNARVCDSLDEALAESQTVIGASARSRKMTWPLMNPRDCADVVLEKVLPDNLFSATGSDGSSHVSLMFGNEASGLSNEELQRCHYHVNIPAVENFSSLNLAMAVQLITYELRMTLLLKDGSIDKTQKIPTNSAIASVSTEDGEWDEPLANVSEVEGFFEHLERTLVQIGFHDPKNPRQLMTRLRRLYQRVHMDKMEVNILRGILTATLKASRKD